jgi:NADPH-dependent 2,4-dienoyl-CoA reductase/sulfur reductase-like enzyme
MIIIHVLTLAQEIGVHRNTIRNWVKTGRIEAKPGPGKGLLFTTDTFERLCQEFNLDPERLQSMAWGTQMAAGPAPILPRALAPAPAADRPGKIVGSVMVVGGGIAGIQAALDLADSGYYVHLVEKSPGIGGKMSQLDKTYPTNDCAM